VLEGFCKGKPSVFSSVKELQVSYYDHSEKYHNLTPLSLTAIPRSRLNGRGTRRVVLGGAGRNRPLADSKQAPGTDRGFPRSGFCDGPTPAQPLRPQLSPRGWGRFLGIWPQSTSCIIATVAASTSCAIFQALAESVAKPIVPVAAVGCRAVDVPRRVKRPVTTADTGRHPQFTAEANSQS